jgi:putative Holliday junction resolvase
MPEHDPNQLTALGFDFGRKNIGVAIGNTLLKEARALTTLKADNGIPNWDEIKQLVQRWQAQVLVVGVPYHMDGSEQHTTFAARKFAKRLSLHCDLAVHLVDERLTSIEARQQVQRRTKRAAKSVDKEAAAIILNSWLQQYTPKE